MLGGQAVAELAAALASHLKHPGGTGVPMLPESVQGQLAAPAHVQTFK